MLPRTQCIRFAWTVVLMLLATAGHAAEPLVWKFEPGMTNRYRMTQTMDMSIDVGGNNVANKIRQVIDMSWQVKDVKEDGSAVLEQKIDRMRMTIDAGGQKIEVDSASEEQPQGLGAMLAPLLKAFTAESFEVTMSPRGEITEVIVPEGMVEALKNSPGAAAMGEMASAEGFKKMVSQAAFALPEKLEPGGKWTQKMEMKLPGIGTQIAETTYEYKGTKEVEGQQYEVFSPTMEIRYEGGETPAEVTKQDSSGEILFNREAGRMERSKLKQNMTVKLTAGGQAMEQKVDQTVEMNWLPEDAAEESE